MKSNVLDKVVRDAHKNYRLVLINARDNLIKSRHIYENAGRIDLYNRTYVELDAMIEAHRKVYP